MLRPSRREREHIFVVLSFFVHIGVEHLQFLETQHAFGDTLAELYIWVHSACIETDTHPAPLADYLPFELVHAGI
jgi:hypothetical protein